MTDTIRVELEGERIVLTGWVGPSTPDKCKAVGGGRFRPKKPGTPAHWTFPLSLGTCRAIRAQFGDALTIGPALNTWAKAKVAEENDLGHLALADDAVLSRVPLHAPTLHKATETRTYQKVAAKWGSVTGSFLLADQQGLGKTIETLATIIETAPETDKPQWHMIFSPSVAVDIVWAAEVRRWLADAGAVALPLVGSLAEREALLKGVAEDSGGAIWRGASGARHIFVVANIESARIKPHFAATDEKRRKPKYDTKDAVLPALHSRIWDTVVVDECQRALIRTSGKLTQTRAGFEVLSRNSERRIALSGTPMRGKPEQLWGTLHWLRPDVYTSYWNWVKRYFALTSNGFSNYLLNGFLPGGKERLAEDLKSIMLRRTKAEVAADLPPKTYAGTLMDPDDLDSPCGIWLEQTPAQRKQLATFERDGVLDFGELGEVLVDHQIVDYTRRKQLANAVHTLDCGVVMPTLDSPKYAWLLNWLREADGEKVVVSSQFTKVINVFAEGLRAEGYNVSVLTGETAMGKRKTMVEDFQSDDGEAQVFMLNTKAGGVALTLDAADYLVLLDETTVPDEQEQVEDRIHRISRMHNVTIYYLRTLGTLDEEIAWVAAAREDINQYLLDGARGIEHAKRLYHQKKNQEQNSGA